MITVTIDVDSSAQGDVLPALLDTAVRLLNGSAVGALREDITISGSGASLSIVFPTPAKPEPVTQP